MVSIFYYWISFLIEFLQYFSFGSLEENHRISVSERCACSSKSSCDEMQSYRLKFVLKLKFCYRLEFFDWSKCLLWACWCFKNTALNHTFEPSIANALLSKPVPLLMVLFAIGSIFSTPLSLFRVPFAAAFALKSFNRMILRSVSFFELSEKCSSISSRDRSSVSGKIRYITINPMPQITQYSIETPGIESAVSKL